MKVHLSNSIPQRGAAREQTLCFIFDERLVADYNNRAAVSPQEVCQVYNPQRLPCLVSTACLQYFCCLFSVLNILLFYYLI